MVHPSIQFREHTPTATVRGSLETLFFVSASVLNPIAVQLANLWVVHCFLQDVDVSLTWGNFKANEIRKSWCNDLIHTTLIFFG